VEEEEEEEALLKRRRRKKKGMGISSERRMAFHFHWRRFGKPPDKVGAPSFKVLRIAVLWPTENEMAVRMRTRGIGWKRCPGKTRTTMGGGGFIVRMLKKRTNVWGPPFVGPEEEEEVVVVVVVERRPPLLPPCYTAPPILPPRHSTWERKAKRKVWRRESKTYLKCRRMTILCATPAAGKTAPCRMAPPLVSLRVVVPFRPPHP